MIDFLLSLLSLFYLFSFFIILTIRNLFLRRVIPILLYYTFLGLIFFVLALGRGGVENEELDNLEKFIWLEKNNQIEEVKNNQKPSDNILNSYLDEFKTSEEFKNYIKPLHNRPPIEEDLLIAWFLVCLVEISNLFTRLMFYIFNKIKGRISDFR